MGAVALVHDYHTQRGGAERVVLSMTRAFPGAPLHTSLYDPAGTFPEFAASPVHTLALDRVGAFRRNHRLALPMLALAFSSLKVEADVVLCSSSGWAHGVRTSGRKVVYCYSPARWLYDSRRYLGDRRPPVATAALAALRAPLLAWDRRQAASAHRYLTLSRAVQARLRHVYGIAAEVVPPPYALGPEGPSRPVPGVEAGFHLCVARLLPYKNVTAVVEAFAGLPGERLVVVGEGPARAEVAAVAGANVTVCGSVDDAQLRWLYRHCRFLVAASYEDYGLTPLEAAAFGKPSAVLRFGGYLDTVEEGETGLFFDRPEPAAIAEAVRRLHRHDWDDEVIRAHAGRFCEDRFITRLREVVAEEGTR